MLDQRHYAGSSTDTVVSPTPYGQRARQQLAAVPHADRMPAPRTITRPMATYAALVDALQGGR